MEAYVSEGTIFSDYVGTRAKLVDMIGQPWDVVICKNKGMFIVHSGCVCVVTEESREGLWLGLIWQPGFLREELRMGDDVASISMTRYVIKKYETNLSLLAGVQR